MNKSKSDVWMPVYIGDLLADTQHLTDEQFGKFHKILYHQWRHGHFSEDELLAICGFSGPVFESASSTSQVELKQVFSRVLAGIKQLLKKDADDLWFSPRCDFEKAKWFEKKRVFVDRARKGGIAKARRRNEELAKSGAKIVASSTGEAVLEGVLDGCTSPREVQKQKPEPPPTPSTSRRGTDAPSTPAAPGSAPPPGPVRTTPAAARASNPSPPRSVETAKPPKFAPRAVQNGSGSPTPHHGRSGALAVLENSEQQFFSEAVDSAEADPRRQQFRTEILAFWREQNPAVPDYRFSAADQRALDDVLERFPSLTLTMLQASLRNRARSEVSPGARPHKWLRSILEFADEPLDRFSKPLRAARQV